MMKMLDVLDTLELTSSTKEKERLLKENQSPELKEYLNLALNPYKVFYVSKFPTGKIPGKAAVVIAGTGFSSFKILCEKLESREISGHVALNTIHEVFSRLTKQEAKWFRKALVKDPIGVGCTVVNNAIGNTIPTFEVMLADNKQPNLDELTYPVIIQQKFDGFRAVYIPGLGLMGRNGKRIRNENLRQYFDGLYRVTDFVFDGELYSHTVGFNEIASILNSDDKEIPAHIEYVVYDGMELTDWNNQACKLGYSDRYAQVVKKILANGLSTISKNENILITSCKTVNSADEVRKEFKGYLEEGYEGAMLKDPNGKYKWGRTRLSQQTMMKLKPSITEDLAIVDFEEGEGRLKGTCGKLIVDFNGVNVGVGSGLTDELRAEIWDNRTRYKGRIIEVKGMEVTEDKSIRHPVFIRFRDDK